MTNRTQQILLCGCIALCSLNSDLARAAPPVITVQSVTAPAPDIGSVVYSSGGDTVFEVNASTGTVSRISGAGVRVTSGSAVPALVTVTCTGGNAVGDCLAATESATIGVTGTPTGRAKSLTNFSVVGGPSPAVLSSITGTTSLSFTVGGIPQNATRNFYVGMRIPISGTA